MKEQHMTDSPIIEAADRRPSGHRAVPLLAEHDLGHYPEYREFFAETFALREDPFGPPPLLQVGGRHYELVFVGWSGRPFPGGLRINALVPGLEPLDEDLADLDLWDILRWLVDGVGGEWDAEALTRTGRIYKVAPDGRQ